MLEGGGTESAVSGELIAATPALAAVVVESVGFVSLGGVEGTETSVVTAGAGCMERVDVGLVVVTGAEAAVLVVGGAAEPWVEELAAAASDETGAVSVSLEFGGKDVSLVTVEDDATKPEVRASGATAAELVVVVVVGTGGESDGMVSETVVQMEEAATTTAAEAASTED